MKHSLSISSHVSPALLKASKAQQNYFYETNYDLVTPGGGNYKRDVHPVAFDAQSGDLLVRENVSFNGGRYEKLYVLSKDGKPEKFKGRLA